MSSQWMPFALYGFRRYFDTRRAWPLAGAALALVAQNWSCGYFLLYFAPFAAAYVLYEIADRGLWRERADVGRTRGAPRPRSPRPRVPFLLPYLALRAHGFGPRPLGGGGALLGRRLQLPDGPRRAVVLGRHRCARSRSPRANCSRPSFPSLLALVGLAAHARVTWAVTQVARRRPRCAALAPRGRSARRRSCSRGNGAGRVVILARTRLRLSLGPAVASACTTCAGRCGWRSSPRPCCSSSRGARGRSCAACPGRPSRSTPGPCSRRSGCRSAPSSSRRASASRETGLYAWFYRNVPGFDGLRVPARMGMIVALFLAVLGGYGARAIERRVPAVPVPSLAAVVPRCFLVEASPAPIKLNGTWTRRRARRRRPCR